MRFSKKWLRGARKVQRGTFPIPPNRKAQTKMAASYQKAIPESRDALTDGWPLTAIPQFPSNGKAHVSTNHSASAVVGNAIVFQFPSNGKAHVNLGALSYLKVDAGYRFNSLQTGRHMWTEDNWFKIMSFIGWFQFPSNGKAHANKLTENVISGICDGFNSLQTGRHMWTFSQRVFHSSNQKKSFNSLQTGRHMWTPKGL